MILVNFEIIVFGSAVLLAKFYITLLETFGKQEIN